MSTITVKRLLLPVVSCASATLCIPSIALAADSLSSSVSDNSNNNSNNNPSINLAAEDLPMTTLDKIVVTATPLRQGVDDMAVASSVITSQDITQRSASTLGDIFINEPGVSADTFGQGASRPIIRGQTAPRIKVMQNGLNVQDASQISPDHQVAVPVREAEQIEVIKGVSTLMYGSSAVGGVVNVVDFQGMNLGQTTDKNPQASMLAGLTGEATVIGQQATDGYLVSGKLGGGMQTNNGNALTWQATVQHSDQGNIQVPHWDSDDIDNSWHEQDNLGLNLGYMTNQSYVGASYQKLTSEYGLPFHVHNQCQPVILPNGQAGNTLDCGGHAHEHNHEHEHEHGEAPYIDLESDIFGLYTSYNDPFKGFRSVTGRLSYTDYEHDEIDEGAVGTSFDNVAWNIKFDATHYPIDTRVFGINGIGNSQTTSLKGVVGVDYQKSDFSAVGLEGYLPQTDTKQIGVYWIERLSPTAGMSFGTNTTSTTASVTNATVAANHASTQSGIGHNHSHAADAANNNSSVQQNNIAPSQTLGDKTQEPWYVEFGVRQDFQEIEDNDNHTSEDHTGTSLSIEGGRYLTPTTQIAARVSHSQRLPASQELFANGAHLATNTWERGNPDLDKEKTTGIELTYRYDNGVDFDAEVSTFYNHSKDYIYAKTQDIVTEGESAGFRLVDYSQVDANHYGGEAKMRYWLNDIISIGGFADIALIKFDGSDSNGAIRQRDYAPRLAAPRMGGDITVQIGQFDLVMSGHHGFQQDHIADFETDTPSYNMLNAKLVYYSNSKYDYTAMLQVNNLLNELAYNHASYLSEHVPKPERSVNFGLTYRF